MSDEKELALNADKIWQGVAFLMSAIAGAISFLFKRHIKRIDDQGERIDELEKQMPKKVSHEDVTLMFDSLRNEIREQGKEATRRIDQILAIMANGK